MKCILLITWDILCVNVKVKMYLFSISGVRFWSHRQMPYLSLNSVEFILIYVYANERVIRPAVFNFSISSFCSAMRNVYMGLNAKVSDQIIWARLFSFCAFHMYITGYNLASIFRWTSNLTGGFNVHMEVIRHSPEILLHHAKQAWWINVIMP